DRNPEAIIQRLPVGQGAGCRDLVIHLRVDPLSMCERDLPGQQILNVAAKTPCRPQQVEVGWPRLFKLSIHGMIASRESRGCSRALPDRWQSQRLEEGLL